MNFTLFLSTYCSDRVKARYSLLHKKNYVGRGSQFLGHERRAHSDGEQGYISYTLGEHEVTVDALVSLGHPPTKIGDITNMYLEYIASPPRVWVRTACIKVGDGIVAMPLYPGNKVYIIKSVVGAIEIVNVPA